MTMIMKRFVVRASYILLICSLCPIATLSQIRRSIGKANQEKESIVLGELGEVLTNRIAQKRDLAQYQQGGHFDCRIHFLDGQRGTCRQSDLNEFIWQNWHRRRLAYVRLTRNSPDAAATYHIFIEPNPKGAWTIFCRLARWHALPGGSGVVEFPRAYSVEKFVSGPNADFFLVFKNEVGQLIQGFKLNED
jgi:hypothetical protein